MATYAIGDVHGCFEELQALLSTIHFDIAHDTLWFAGDLVNRGPQSLETLRFIKSLPRTVITLGNHDLHFLAIRNGSATLTAKDSLHNCLAAKDCDELCGWLRQQAICHYDPALGYVMVHAGIAPQWDVPLAIQLAGELERVLKSEQHAAFFDNMYGESPICWRDDLVGWDRLRFITNAFTRMRFCDEKGALVLRKKSTLPPQEPELIPWYDVASRKSQDAQVLFGHWAALKGSVGVDDVFALDTGCVWGGQLSAMRLEDKTWFRVDSGTHYQMTS